jgi:hypothetical protein
VYREKYVEQFPIIDFVGIEGDANNFNVSRVATADLLVGRIGDVSAHVAGFNVTNARETLKDGLNTPETSAAKDRCLLFCHGG